MYQKEGIVYSVRGQECPRCRLYFSRLEKVGTISGKSPLPELPLLGEAHSPYYLPYEDRVGWGGGVQNVYRSSGDGIKLVINMASSPLTCLPIFREGKYSHLKWFLAGTPVWEIKTGGYEADMLYSQLSEFSILEKTGGDRGFARIAQIEQLALDFPVKKKLCRQCEAHRQEMSAQRGRNYLWNTRRNCGAVETIFQTGNLTCYGIKAKATGQVRGQAYQGMSGITIGQTSIGVSGPGEVTHTRHNYALYEGVIEGITYSNPKYGEKVSEVPYPFEGIFIFIEDPLWREEYV